MLATPSAREIGLLLWDRMVHPPKGLPDRRTPWTAYIREVVQHDLAALFRKALPDSQISPYPPDIWSGKDEWLVDICLVEEIPGRGDWLNYKRMLLAAECEWNPKLHEREHDFAKLADIRSERKVFIGQLKSKFWEARRKSLARMREFLQGHQLVPTGEQYCVLLCEAGGEETIEFWLFEKGKPDAELVKSSDLQATPAGPA
jgi:hypothetical protein